MQLRICSLTQLKICYDPAPTEGSPIQFRSYSDPARNLLSDPAPNMLSDPAHNRLSGPAQNVLRCSSECSPIQLSICTPIHAAQEMQPGYIAGCSGNRHTVQCLSMTIAACYAHVTTSSNQSSWKGKHR
eukprot:scpid85322/ scgid23336/ 